jgi:hypothetical protein
LTPPAPNLSELVEQRREAIRALAAVSQDSTTKVQEAKRSLIESLEARQDALLDMRFAEKSISPTLFKRRQEQLQNELDAAHASLAESQKLMEIGLQQLEMALELATNVAKFYVEADEATKRRLNQAFFKKLYVVPDWDEYEKRVIRIDRAELSEPFAVLLAEDLAPDVLKEAEAIKAGAAEDAENRLGAPVPALDQAASDDVSYFVKLVRSIRQNWTTVSTSLEKLNTKLQELGLLIIDGEVMFVNEEVDHV